MDCIFCKIIAGELPSKKVYEDDSVFAFEDIQPAAPHHVLIIPKKHISSMAAVSDDEWTYIADIHKAAQQIARKLGVEGSGYRLINNCGPDGGQVVFHLHYHLLAGEKLGALNG